MPVKHLRRIEGAKSSGLDVDDADARRLLQSSTTARAEQTFTSAILKVTLERLPADTAKQ